MAGSPPPLVLNSHADTLGAMVKEINPNGCLRMTKIGSITWNMVEGEGCMVLSCRAESVRGSILFEMASTHEHDAKVNEPRREDDNMEIHLDALVSTTQHLYAYRVS